MESRLTNIQPALNKTKKRTVFYYIEKPAFPEENAANMTIMKIQIPFKSFLVKTVLLRVLL